MNKYESRQPCYFATPPVQLILALHESLTQLNDSGMIFRVNRHRECSNTIKDLLVSWGLKLVPKHRTIAGFDKLFLANTLSAVYYPNGITGQQLLPKIVSKGVMLAGGLHPNHSQEYFRIGHVN